MNEVGIFIAKCPLCGKNYYGLTEEEANERYETLHKCVCTLLDKELDEILEKAIRKEN